MKILITGATGLIGRVLSVKLLEAGHDLVILSRNAERARNSLALPAKYFSWQPETSTPPPEALLALDGVVHLAGESVMANRWNEARKKNIRDSRVLGTKNLVQGLQAIQGKRPEVFIAGSAVGIYGNRGDEVLNEESPAGEGFLAEVCKDWEAEGEKAATDGVRVVHLRTGVVFSTQGGALRQLADIFQAGFGSPVGSGKQWLSWVHIDDHVAIIVEALKNPGIRGPVNATAPEPATNYELSRLLAKTLRRALLPRVPAPALRLVLGEMATEALSSARIFPRRMLTAGFQFAHPSLEPALVSLLRGQDGKVSDEFSMVQWVPKPLREVFTFFGDERNLEALTPAWLNFQVLGKSTASLQSGSLIDYRLKLHGFPVRWQSRIDRWEPPKLFSDTQMRGPYSYWEHTHYFSELRGGTLIRDNVRYRLPGGILGKGVAGRWIRKDLEKIFGFRKKTITEVFGRD